MIIVIHGNDYYQAKQKLKTLKDKYIHDVDNQGTNLMIINGENID